MPLNSVASVQPTVHIDHRGHSLAIFNPVENSTSDAAPRTQGTASEIRADTLDFAERSTA